MINSNLAKKNQINTFLNNYFNLFVVVFVSFTLFVAYLFLLKPKVDETTMTISENISSHEKLLQAEKNKLTSLQAAVLSYNNINKVDLDRVNTILPDDYDKEALYGEVEEIIKQNGFTPTSISITKDSEIVKPDTGSDVKAVVVPEISDKVGTVNVSVNISAIDYAGLKNLLQVFENNLRIINVKKVTLGDKNSASLEFSTYYYKK